MQRPESHEFGISRELLLSYKKMVVDIGGANLFSALRFTQFNSVGVAVVESQAYISAQILTALQVRDYRRVITLMNSLEYNDKITSEVEVDIFDYLQRSNFSNLSNIFPLAIDFDQAGEHISGIATDVTIYYPNLYSDFFSPQNIVEVVSQISRPRATLEVVSESRDFLRELAGEISKQKGLYTLNKFSELDVGYPLSLHDMFKISEVGSVSRSLGVEGGRFILSATLDKFC